MSKRKNKRMKCPKCSAKGLECLNKKQQIFQCKRESCGHKFMYIPQSRTFLALKDQDLQIVEAKPTDESPVKETKEIKPDVAKDPLLQMAEDLGF